MRWGIAAALLALGTAPTHAGDLLTGVASTFSDREIFCPPRRINPHTVMGIAHRTLPCGTVVEITNRANGRVVKAVVVDRGPCGSGKCPARVLARPLDLLPMVARALGSNGLVRVAYRVIPGNWRSVSAGAYRTRTAHLSGTAAAGM